MSDDIVTRLRATGIVEPPLVTPEEAADEIERLRAEVLKAYEGFNYWEERCIRAEECLDFIYRKKRRWRLW
jgi:hypothetical protein